MLEGEGEGEGRSANEWSLSLNYFREPRLCASLAGPKVDHLFSELPHQAAHTHSTARYPTTITGATTTRTRHHLFATINLTFRVDILASTYMLEND